MNILDVRTVLFNQLITDAVCTLVLALLWWQNRNRSNGMLFWVADFFFQTAAVLLIILRGAIPDWLSLGAPNPLIVAGALMGLWGLETFVGKKRSQIYNLITLGIFVFIHYYFIYAQPSLDFRNLNLSLGLLVFCSQCTWLMLRNTGCNLTHTSRVVGWVFAIFCLTSLIRLFVLLVHPLQSNDFFLTGLYDRLILVVYQVLLILLTFGLVLMVNRWLLRQVQNQEEKLTKVFHSSPNAILITRLADGLILDVNRGFEEMTGYSAAEAIGKTTLGLGLWVKETDHQAASDELAARGEVQGHEFQVRTKSGRELTGLFYTELLNTGSEPLIIFSINDITKSKLADKIREESQTRYRSLFENMLNGFAYCQMIYEGGHPSDFIYLDVNHSFETMTGLKAVIGKKVSDLIPGIRDTDQLLIETYGRVALTGRPEVFETYIQALKMWVSISVYCPKKGFFVAVFDVITGRKLSEEKLRYQATLLDEVNEAIIASDADYRITAWNRAAETIYGWKAGEVLGRFGLEITQTAFPELDKQKMLEAIEAAGKYRGEATQVRKDGSHFPVDLSSIVLHNDQGGITGYVSVNRDITDRKQAEQTIANLARFPSDNPNPVLRLSRAGSLLYANQAAFTMLSGLISEVDKPVSEALIEPGRSVFDLQVAKEIEITCRDRTFSLSIAPTSGNEYVNLYGLDITLRKQAENALRISEDKFKYIFDYSIVGKSITAPGGMIHANQAFCDLLGYAENELQGKSWQDTTHPDDIQATQTEVNAMLSGEKESTRFTKRYLHKDGSVIWTDISTSLRRDAQGQPLYFMTTVLDITERKQAEEELKRSNAELEQFAYVASHDLQEPLRMVSSYVQLIKRRYHGKLDQDADEFIDFAVDGAERMRRLINDLLAYSRLGTRGQVFAPTACEHVLEQALDNLQITIHENQAQISHDPLPEILADEGQLVQLFQNLIGNAIKFNETKPPKVHISAALTARASLPKREGGAGWGPGSEVWLISVHDNGIGIDPRYAERIFIIFQRLNERNKFPGTGIGLALCRKIVQRHGGQIWVESSPNEGATFFFTLPQRGDK